MRLKDRYRLAVFSSERIKRAPPTTNKTKRKPLKKKRKEKKEKTRKKQIKNGIKRKKHEKIKNKNGTTEK